MSNKIIILWGFVIVVLVSAIYIIGIKYEEEVKYINLKNEIKSSVKKYIKDNRVEVPLVVTTEELESKGYIGELKLEEKVCAADVTVDKKFLFYSYDIDFTCVYVEA